MRGPIVLIVLFVLLIGGAILLSRSVSEQPLRTIEVPVAAAPAPAPAR
jgi:hypothetical protein